jgi:PST family polysaccharide transporter
MGTGAALIQRQVADPHLVASVFSLNALLSAGGGLCTALVAPFTASFFNAPVLEPVLQVLAVSLAVAGLGVVPQAVMERDGRFDELAKIELGGLGAGVLTGIAMALNGWGIWSLVGQSVVTSLVTTALLTLASSARPTLHPDWTQLRSIAGYSLNLAGFNVSNYLMRNADNAIIGKRLGSWELGYYALAYQIAIGPVRAIGAIVGRVLFPSLSRIQHDHPALRKEYMRAVGLMVSICFPLMAMLIALADVGTVALLGESWRPMVPILVVLALVGFVQSPLIATGSMCLALGRTDILMRWGLATNTLAILAFWIAAQWSALAVAIGYLVVTCALAYPWFRILFRLVGLTTADVLRASARPFIGSLLAGSIAWSIAQSMEQSFEALSALAAGGSAGTLFYVLWHVVLGHATPLKRQLST